MIHIKLQIYANITLSLLVGVVLAGCVEAEIVSEAVGLKALNEELPEDFRYGPVSKNIAKIIDGTRWNNYFMGKKDKLYLTDEIDKASDPNIVCYDKTRSSLARLHNDPLVVDLTPIAERGDISAQLKLGALYNKKKGIENRYIAWTWYQCAADAGEPKGQHMVGSMYAEFSSQEVKVNKAIKWHTLAAEQEYVKSQVALGLLYKDVRHDREASLKWLNKAAQNGDEQAKKLIQMNLGHKVSVREKTEPAALKKQEASKQTEQIAEEEPIKAQEQEDVARNKAAEEMAVSVLEAEQALKKAAEERAKARSLAQAKAIEARNMALAEDKAARELVAKNNETQPSEGENTDEGAAENQALEKSSEARALFQTAYAYDTGRGVEKNPEKAIENYKLSAEMGDAAAQYNLGLIYRMGKGATKDPAEAAKLFNLAAEQGHTGAQHVLGEMFYGGEGVKKDFSQSVRWRKAAAEAGEPLSQEALSAMYRDGQGVEQDNVRANTWLEIAIANETSKSLRESWKKRQALLTKRMKPEEIAESKRLAEEWAQNIGVEEKPQEPQDKAAVKDDQESSQLYRWVS